MKQLDAALKKQIHLFFMKTSVPRILAEQQKEAKEA